MGNTVRFKSPRSKSLQLEVGDVALSRRPFPAKNKKKHFLKRENLKNPRASNFR